ncbi:MAG: hypothetical protein A2Y62_01025 [Candidatus Fischerbacteria bacterium RBG_13_37_8]|uniref:Uncharacterized protein n=1 Tax=Candidatus Fischerbacteria bacterium RBG_13_37_8 TaxID=1817863 RepID=A0A1F5VT96_9BACT|nr:MAG: hypothetical protein A2Y62_01025 [Candidatus Fischerbacteria bacterium RBG_13_37_8]
MIRICKDSHSILEQLYSNGDKSPDTFHQARLLFNFLKSKGTWRDGLFCVFDSVSDAANSYKN